MTEWRTRRTWNGNVLCGRRGPDGQYACQGPIGAVAADGIFRFPPGIVQDLSRPGWWQGTRHSQRKMAVGELSRWRHVSTSTGGERVLVWKEPTLPARRSCPHCNCTAVIDSAVLDSPQ